MRRWLAGAALCASLSITGAAMAADNDQRLVIVSGRGEISVAPDRADLPMAVEARNLSLDIAQDEVNRIVAAFLQVCKDLRIPEERIQTAQISVRPEYDWNQRTRERRLIGYFVSRQIQVDLRDLEKLGLLIERATDVGVNQISGPQLDSSRKSELRRDALSRAAEDARANAEAVARTLGGRVGPVHRIDATELGYQPPIIQRGMMAARGAMAEDAAAATYSTGEIQISAQVRAEFDLLVR